MENGGATEPDLSAMMMADDTIAKIGGGDSGPAL